MTYRIAKMVALLVVLACGCNCHSAASTQGKAAQSSEVPSAAQQDPKSSQGVSAEPSIALPEVPPADPRERYIAAAVARLLPEEHLAGRPIDDEVSRQAFDYYLERLDPAKLFLLQGHVRALRKSADQLDDQLAEGDLKLARLGGAILASQRKKVAAMVADLTREPFDLTLEESFETDVEKRDYAASNEELKDRWRRSLKHQVLERMAEMRRAAEEPEGEEPEDKGRSGGGDDAKQGEEPADDQAPSAKVEEEAPTTDAGREAKAREELATAFAGRFKRLETEPPLDSVETFVNAVAAVFGPHTLFLAPDDKANFDIQMTGSLEGIGAVLSEGDHYIEVREVVPGGAAWRQGDLEAGDLILAVQQQQDEPVDVADMRLSEVVKMIRGPKGTVVTLSVRKPDGRLTSIVITRDVVVVEATYARGAVLDLLGKGHAPVGYVYLPGFYGNTRSKPGNGPQRNATDDVRALLQRFKRRNIGGVILDLRGNGGGLLSHATSITGLFIEKGPTVQVRAAGGESEVLEDEDPDVVYDGRLIVLVDRFSASASEILAGALQDYDRALVVGTGPTHGKGTVQMLLDFDRMLPHQGPSLGVLKLTTQQFFLVDGESTQLRGVQPDVVLPDPASFVESGERYLENPVPWSKVNPLSHENWPAHLDRRALAERSGERQKRSEVFDRVRKRGAYLQERRDDTNVPLQLSMWRARDEAEDKALDELDPKLEDQPPRFTVELVRYRPEPTADGRDSDARETAEERIAKWRDQLARDPWVAESLYLMSDMAASGKK